MSVFRINLGRIVNYLLVIAISVGLLYVGRQILIPLSFALLFAFMLYPICDYLEKRIMRIPAILVAFLMVIIILTGVFYFFGSQFFSLFENLKDFSNNIQAITKKMIDYIDAEILGNNVELIELYKQNKSGRLFDSINILEKTLTLSTTFLANVALVFVYAFLFLLYRTSFKNFFLYQFRRKRKKEEIEEVLTSIQKVAQHYFYGLFLIILILGLLNGFGLWIIGIDYPFLFGFFAAFLAIIPYIGTFIGGLLPTLYAAVNNETLIPALLVVSWYIMVQTLEGNILTPKIVGSRVSINPLFALLALLIGGVLWGIAGLVLFIPFIAIVKVIFEHVESLEPYAILLSSDFGYKKTPFLKYISKKVNKSSDNKKQ
ncbi:MAG: AI-2E family transporter [Bacteroidetes bacterium]|jgi:predicted PurR-regulated permease PerM|nr:AI-2E family transporter [Bacteroidota bacterium]